MADLVLDDALVRRHLTEEARRTFGVRRGFVAYDARYVAGTIAASLVAEVDDVLAALETWAATAGGDIEPIRMPARRGIRPGVRVEQVGGPHALRLNVPKMT